MPETEPDTKPEATADDMPSEEFTRAEVRVEEAPADSVGDASLPLLYKIITLRAIADTVAILLNHRHEEERERNVAANEPAALESRTSDST